LVTVATHQHTNPCSLKPTQWKRLTWESLLDYGRIAWQLALEKALKNPGIIEENALAGFEAN
jgi:hypothetical protein